MLKKGVFNIKNIVIIEGKISEIKSQYTSTKKEDICMFIIKNTDSEKLTSQTVKVVGHLSMLIERLPKNVELYIRGRLSSTLKTSRKGYEWCEHFIIAEKIRIIGDKQGLPSHLHSFIYSENDEAEKTALITALFSS